MIDFLIGLLFSSVFAAGIVALLLLLRPIIKDKIPLKYQYYSWFLVFLRFLLIFSAPAMFIIPVSAVLHASPVSSNVVSSMATTSQGNLQPLTPNQVTPTIIAPINMAHPSNFILHLVFGIWLLGTVTMLGIHVVSYLRYEWRIKRSRKQVTDLHLLDWLQVSCEKVGLKQTLPLYISCCVDMPMLCGLVHPSIVIPDRYFSPKELKYTFLHEGAHCYRHDNLFKWMAVIAMSIHWFNPAAYLAVKELSRYCELSCDEAITSGFSHEERLDYGNTLLDMVSRNERRPFPLTASICEEKRNLKERLEFLMKGNNKRLTATSVAVLSIVVIVTVLSVVLTGCRLAAKEQAPAAGTNGSVSSQAGSSAIRPSAENSTAQSSTGSNTSSAIDPDSIQIVNTVSDKLKKQYPDLIITNEWLGEKDAEYRYVVLFGALKEDPRQGVAQVIRFDPNCTKVLSQQRYLEPEKHGALRVIELGAKGNSMVIMDSDGRQMSFLYNTGFTLY